MAAGADVPLLLEQLDVVSLRKQDFGGSFGAIARTIGVERVVLAGEQWNFGDCGFVLIGEAGEAVIDADTEIGR